LGAHEEDGELVDPSPAWVRRNVPGKRVLGQRTIRWYEGEVNAWIESRPAEMPEKPRHPCTEAGCDQLAAASRAYCPTHHKAHHQNGESL